MNRETLDPILEFTAPADGEYFLGIEDDRGDGGSDYVYRIEIQPEENAVFTYIAPEPENQFQPQLRQNIAVPAGNRTTAQIAVFATNRPFNGDLELAAVGKALRRQHGERVALRIERAAQELGHRPHGVRAPGVAAGEREAQARVLDLLDGGAVAPRQ